MKNIELINMGNEKPTYYMFRDNLKQINRQVDLLLNLDEEMIDDTLVNGHDWAADHISTAKEDIEQVYNFFMNQADHDMNLTESMYGTDLSDEVRFYNIFMDYYNSNGKKKTIEMLNMMQKALSNLD
jgi:glutamyl/glutaminyl-tRNA synthetase